jgi:hypothetical protein
VSASGVVPCPFPAKRQDAPFDLHAFDDPPQLLNRAHGAGAVVADFFGDGRPDAFFFGSKRAELVLQDPDGTLHHNPGGVISAEVPMDMGFGGSVADFDADGDLDVYMSRYQEPNVLLENVGDGTFRDVAAERGVQGAANHFSASSSWADVDRDGDLDLFVSGHGFVIEGQPIKTFEPGNPSYLFLNDGAGHFTDGSGLLPQAFHDTYTFVGTWVDLNRDGWPDLYGINDLGNKFAPCMFLWNQGPKGFVADESAGLDVDVAGMGVGVGDLNGDAADDFLISAWGRVKLLYSSPAGVWIDFAQATGVLPAVDAANQEVGWATELADMDNDGDLDAPMVFGFLSTEFIYNERSQPDALWLQQADGTFVDEAPAWGVADLSAGRGLVVADLNRDGWLDLVKPDVAGPSLIHLSRCGEEAWLQVTLRDPTVPNGFAIGARVEVEAEGRLHYRHVMAGSTSYGSGGPPEIHFGFGSLDQVDRVRVIWPDGEVGEAGPVATRQFLTLTRP